MPRTPALKTVSPDEITAEHQLQTLDTDETAEDTPADRIASLLSDQRSERAYVNLYRVGAEQNLIFLRTMKPEEFESAGGFDFIRRAYGGGTFEVRLYDTSPTGRFNVRAKPRVTIEDSRLPDDAAPIAGTAAPVLDRLLARLDALESRMTAAPDPMVGMDRAFALIGKMRDAMGPPPAAAPSQVSSLLETVQALKVIREEIEPPPAPEPNSLAALAGPVLEMLRNAQTAAPQVIGAAPVAPALAQLPTIALPSGMNISPALAPASAPMPAENPAESFELRLWNLFLDELMRRAARSADVEETASLVFEHAPDEALSLLRMDLWFDQLSAQRPQATEFRPWFESVRERVLRMIAEDEAD